MKSNISPSLETQQEALKIAKDETIVFKPHGFHLMMFAPHKPIEKGTIIDITLTFEKAGTLPLKLKVGQPRDRIKPNSHMGHSPHHSGH